MNETVFHILVSIAAGELSAKVIRKRVGKLSGGKQPPITSFYRALANAEEAGWIEVVRAQRGTGGRPAQTYRITDDGRNAVRARARELRKLTDLVLVDDRAPEARS